MYVCMYEYNRILVLKYPWASRVRSEQRFPLVSPQGLEERRSTDQSRDVSLCCLDNLDSIKCLQIAQYLFKSPLSYYRQLCTSSADDTPEYVRPYPMTYLSKWSKKATEKLGSKGEAKEQCQTVRWQAQTERRICIRMTCPAESSALEMRNKKQSDKNR